MLGKIQSICVEDIPKEFHDWVFPKLSSNGGNVIYIEHEYPFSNWLVSQGFVFDMPRREDLPKTWAWLVIFR